MTTKEDIENKMFTFLYSAVSGECGDGWGLVIVKHDNHEEVGKRFQQWIKDRMLKNFNLSLDWEILTNKDCCTVSHEQESYVFTKSADGHDLAMNDCVIFY